MKEKVTKQTRSKKQISREYDEILNNEELRNRLISDADQITLDRFKDGNLDKEIERRLLADYKKHSPKRAYVSDSLKPYLKKFPIEFYKQIYRLRGWATDGKKLYRRPSIIGAWTNEIIYYRFHPEVIATLREKNPYVSGGRLFKHFQWLTLLGEDELKQFISDAIRLMTESSYWTQFKRKLAIEAGLPYQGDMFE